ncbi:MAG TPA: ATP-binding domain-containing protein [Acidimicrobiales bacterium]|nr:ATP-binding domain-containing protein [Acidimicrobiales bacterium]
MTSELDGERAYLARAYERLDVLRAAAREKAAESGTGGTAQALYERDVAAYRSAARMASLWFGDLPLCFGRIDTEGGDRHYIGRVAIDDEHREPLVVDWRAPVAEAFYRATGVAPMGLVRRRHFHCRGRRLVAIDDELLGDASTDVEVVGEGALLAALGRTRTGRMGDIVATIQAEQDAAVRAGLPGILVVQGAPGTGKTAVALHRAAYLLYTHRERLERTGVLVVGPNPLFLRYVEGVLPSLGEDTVTMATIADLVLGIEVVGHDTPSAARVKGDARMAEVVRRAVSQRQRRLRQDARVGFGVYSMVVTVEASKRIVAAARKRPGTHNARRPFVERVLLRHLYDLYVAAFDRAVRLGRRGPGDPDSRSTFVAAVRRRPEVRQVLDTLWPRLTPEELVGDLYRVPALLRAAGRGLFVEAELEGLARLEPEWSEADVPLLDEAFALLGPESPPPRAAPVDAVEEQWRIDQALSDHLPDCPRCGSQLSVVRGSDASRLRCEYATCGREWRADQVMSPAEAVRLWELRQRLGAEQVVEQPESESIRRFGHVIVDEAQDVSPMAWRLLARRAAGSSFTVVGDLAQASGSNAPSSWEEALATLEAHEPPKMVELDINYRTPAEIMEVAAAVLAVAAPQLRPPRSVRTSGEQPTWSHVAAGQLVSTAFALAAEANAAGGTVAVIVPAAHRASFGADPVIDLADVDIAVLSVREAKGLEFDSVVVVEPAALVAEHEQGFHALYVALTRATRRLDVVWAGELPQPLAQFA